LTVPRILATLLVRIERRPVLRFASVAEVKNQLSAHLTRARKTKELIVVTQQGKPYALIQPIFARDLEELAWARFAQDQLRQAWEGEDDALYDYL
jgi:antitoxin (DNA-binding transcriptional repressor) of toxin-antitoxin stability system